VAIPDDVSVIHDTIQADAGISAVMSPRNSRLSSHELSDLTKRSEKNGFPNFSMLDTSVIECLLRKLFWVVLGGFCEFLNRTVTMHATVNIVKFEVSTAVTMKNAVFWDVTPCGSCKNRRFEGT
jgi:hypothetical protein